MELIKHQVGHQTWYEDEQGRRQGPYTVQVTTNLQTVTMYTDNNATSEKTLVNGVVKSKTVYTGFENGVVPVGVHRDYYDYENNKIRTVYNIRDGIHDCKRHGKYCEWYPNGQLAKRCHYYLGGLHGVHETWREDGSLISKLEYRLNRRHGVGIHNVGNRGKVEISYYNHGERQSVDDIINLLDSVPTECTES